MPSPNAHEDRQLWSEKAPFWDLHIGDEGDRNRRRHVNPAIWRLLGDVAGLAVLDAGCGTGYLSAMLAERGARVFAVDFAPAMVEQARARFRRLGLALEPVEDDCCALATVPDLSQDRVVSNYVLQDLDDLPGAVRAFWRASRDAGFEVLDFNEPVLQPPYPPDLSPDELQCTLQCAWSVAVHLERPEGQGAGGTRRHP